MLFITFALYFDHLHIIIVIIWSHSYGYTWMRLQLLWMASKSKVKHGQIERHEFVIDILRVW